MLNLRLHEIGPPLSDEAPALRPMLSNVIDEDHTWHDSALDLERGLEVAEHPQSGRGQHAPAMPEAPPLVVALKRL